MEEFTELGDLFDPAVGQGGGGLAVAQLERIFGSIIRLVQGGEVTNDGDSWLVAAVALFNTAGLFLVIGVGLYTLLTVALDTANDGKTFGQRTDTRYTIMRSVMGAIFFIPVAKGFTIAQIALLWLIVQGSALGDKAWSLIAERSIEGQNFVQTSRIYGTVDAAVSGQFADALNALVIGNICANGLNSINRQVSGADDDVIEFDNTPETVTRNEFAVDHRGDNPIRKIVLTHRWQDTSDSYRGSDNICGSVRFEQTITFDESGHDLFDGLRGVAAGRLVANYTTAMNQLADDAAAIANRIRMRDSENAIRQQSVAAVRRAHATYITSMEEDLFSGTGADDLQEAVREVQINAINRVTEDGWVLAPSWQRGISLAVAEYRSTLGSLSLDIKAENNAARYISNNALDSSFFGGRDANPIATSVMAEMNENQTRWATTANAVASEVRRNGAGATGQQGGVDEVDGIITNLFGMLIDLFAVRDDGGYSDPMIDVTEYGHGLLYAGGALSAAAAVADWAPLAGAVSGGVAGFAIGQFVSDMSDVVLKPLGWGLLVAGFITATLIPLLPLIYFFSAVISWLILVVEAMFALPLAVMTLFTPAREGTLIGSWNRILLTIFGVFLRPIFTVIGFFFGMLLIAVALDLAYVLFRDMIVMMQAQGSILRILGLLGLVMAFLIVSFYTVLIGSGMITQIGDGAMAAIGVAFSNSQGAMDVGSRADSALNVGRAIQPIPLGRLGGGGASGAPSRLPNAPAGGGGGGAGGGLAGSNVVLQNGSPRANLYGQGLRAPGAVASAAKKAAAGAATAGNATTRAGKIAQRAASVKTDVKSSFTPQAGKPSRGDKGGAN